MIYLELFYRFFMVGLFSIGGGMATLPFLYDMSARTGWFSVSDIANMLAVSESTPGAIGVNMASYCGYTVAGIPGDLIATLGLITPGIIVILLICRIMDRFRSSVLVQWAMYGLRAASIGLIINAFISVLMVTILNAEAPSGAGGPAGILGRINVSALILAAVIFLGMKYFKKIHPVFFIAFAAAAGVIFSFAGV
ncbi:MAG: chromate transporter [Anaerovoracaceae bacterium]